MLFSPPPADPWIQYHNAKNPQDYDCLSPDSAHDGWYQPRPSVYGDDFDQYYEDAPEDYSDYESEPQTPDLGSPIGLEYDDLHDVSILDGSDDGRADDAPIAARWVEQGPWDDARDVKRELEELPPRPSHPIFFMEDEDEDELPPLDGWYQDVARRNGLEIST